jgi:hypothetical protein
MPLSYMKYSPSWNTFKKILEMIMSKDVIVKKGNYDIILS